MGADLSSRQLLRQDSQRHKKSTEMLSESLRTLPELGSLRPWACRCPIDRKRRGQIPDYHSLIKRLSFLKIIQFQDIAFSILKKAMDEIENCKWASLRLGVIYLKNGEANEAIKLFHNVLRNDPNDLWVLIVSKSS